MNITYDRLMADLEQHRFLPVYYLMGEEAYYIDKVENFIENNALPEEERDFNQMVLFGADVNMHQIIEHAMGYPMMSERQVIIVKECQTLKDTAPLEQYLLRPMPSTVLVFCHKGGSLDKRKKLPSLLTKSDKAALFESKKLREQQLPQFIIDYPKSQGVAIDARAASIIAASIGADLNRLTSELDKLKIGLYDKQQMVTPEIVEKCIGVSKDFNVFELRNAIISRDAFKANQIINYFEHNPKVASVYSILPMLFRYFSDLMQAHYAPQKDEQNLAAWLEISPWGVRDYISGMRQFTATKTLQIIDKFREIDAKSKGLDNPNTPPEELLKELIFFILH